MEKSFELKDVAKAFVAEDGREVRALEGVSFSGSENELLCILGPTGCGKTTILRLLAGLETPTSGEVLAGGERAETGRAPIGYVFQQGALFPWRTVLGNVLFGLECRKMNRTEARRRALECLSLVHLEGFESAYPYELSGGMQQRVALARALAPRPSLLIMDEPFGALDEKTRKNLQEELLRLWAHGDLTVVFVTHNIEEALLLGTRILVLGGSPGRVVEEMDNPSPHPRDRLSEGFVDGLLRLRELIERMENPLPMPGTPG